MISRLESKGIRPTANRILVMKTLMGEQNPQSPVSYTHLLEGADNLQIEETTSSSTDESPSVSDNNSDGSAEDGIRDGIS